MLTPTLHSQGEIQPGTEPLGLPPPQRTLDISEVLANAKSNYAAQVLGSELSKDTPTVLWDSNTLTALPYVPSTGEGQNRNVLAKDAGAVTTLAQLARPCACFDWMVFPDVKKDNLLEVCRQNLGRGNVVVLSKYQEPLEPPNPPGHLTAEYLKGLRYDVDGVLYPVHDAVRRADEFRDPHIRMNLRSFVDGIHDEQKVQAILSAPSPRSFVPDIILDLDDSYKPFKGGLRDLLFPNSNVSEDSEALRSWGLLHSAGYHTLAHKDADGFCTFVYVEHGLKIWTVIRPGNGYLEAADPTDLVSKTMPMIDFENDKGWSRKWEDTNPEVALVELGPGDMIIMPPGTWQEVYTPVQSYCSGGHFLLQEALHLTASSRLFDRQHGLEATNDSHPSTYRTLCRMLIHLTRLRDRRFYLRPVLALCRMVLERNEYRGGGQNAKEAAIDSTRAECQIAAVVALKLIEGLGHLIFDQVVFFSPTPWVDPGPQISQETLDDILSIFRGTALIHIDGKGNNQSSGDFLEWAKASQPQVRPLLTRLLDQATDELVACI